MPYYPPASSGSGGYNLIQEEGVPLTARTTMDFVGATVTATDTGSKTQIAISGAAGTTNTGTTSLDFGTFPGKSDASVDVTGQAGIVAGSTVWAWLYPTDTADHSADEHMLETVRITPGNIVAGTGFTIYGANTSSLTEPLIPSGVSTFRSAVTTIYGDTYPAVGGMGTRIYGAWTVKWAWV